MIDKKSGIWLSNNYPHWFDEPLADALCKFFKSRGTTVADFGCGMGQYLAKFKQQDIDCVGFDGNPHTAELTNGLASVLDLSMPVDVGHFDWVLSLEVGEHIPKNRENTFINNLDGHCRKGIVISWAIPDQGGDGHCNEQPNCYIKYRFSALGFTNSTIIERKLREDATLSWFKDTLMVFVR